MSSSGLNARLGARTEFRIYPSIGIARVGDCADSFMIGPEAPGVAPSGPFRGNDKGIKPQASRFRIYKVEIDANENETVIEEVIPGAKTEIAWSVSLANRKAAGSLIEDTLARKPNPGLRNKRLDRKKLVIAAAGSVTGSGTSGPVLSGSIEFAKAGTTGPKVTDIVLATLRTDDKGRLLVVGGPGKAGSPTNAKCDSFADNDGWYDSISDGPVSATLRIDGQLQAVVPAWVVVTVPRYAPEIYGIVTWFDQALSMARTGADGRFSLPKTTSFTRDIYPILKRTDDLSGVQGMAHANGVIRPLADATRISAFSDQQNRARVQARLTQTRCEAPGPQETPPSMPRLNSGANPDPDGPVWTFLSLTRYQLAHVDNWVNGNFAADWPGSRADADAVRPDSGGAPGLGAVRSRAGNVRRRCVLPRDRGHLRHCPHRDLSSRAEPASGIPHRSGASRGLPDRKDGAALAGRLRGLHELLVAVAAPGRRRHEGRPENQVGSGHPATPAQNAHLNMVALWSQLGIRDARCDGEIRRGRAGALTA